MPINKIIEWMNESSWFRKYNSIIGGFCAGLWVQAHYWREIKATLEAWGIPTQDYMSSLLLIASAAGISLSVVGTIQNNQKIAVLKENQKPVDSNPSV